jgi:hypothetical protein
MKRLILSILLLASGLSAHATTYTVTNINNGGAGSLRDAIDQANAHAGADTIDFDTAGVFSTSQTITLTTGQLGITGALTIDAPSAMAKRVKVTATDQSRVMRVALPGAGTVTIKHLTIDRGVTTDDGGGIQMDSAAGSTLELQDCTVSYCAARDGGGIDAQDSTLVLTDTIFYGCVATRNGGGIFTRGTVTMTGGDCDGRATADGGGIYADGATVTLTGTIVGGSAASGGGIFAKAGTAFSMTGGAVSYGSASGDGGGIRAVGSSTVTLLRVHIRHNTADYGGGIAVRSSTLIATNCIFSNNSGRITGGAVHFQSGTARLKNCTIHLNSVSGGTGYALVAETGGMSLGNTVLQDNGTFDYGYGTNHISGPFVSLGHNHIENIGPATGFTNGVDGDIVGGAGGPTINARLAYGDHAPEAGSPCLEAGDSALVTSPLYGPAPVVDFAGNPRIRGVVDIGAKHERLRPGLAARCAHECSDGHFIRPSVLRHGATHDHTHQRADRAEYKPDHRRPRARSENLGQQQLAHFQHHGRRDHDAASARD